MFFQTSSNGCGDNSKINSEKELFISRATKVASQNQPTNIFGTKVASQMIKLTLLTNCNYKDIPSLVLKLLTNCNYTNISSLVLSLAPTKHSVASQ
jgi:hypothetical protein